jgi:CBS domain-containing protein
MTTARELVTSRFVRIGETHSIAEAIGIIFDPNASGLREIVIVVLDGEGNYLGLLEARSLLKSLGTELTVAGEDPSAQVPAIRRTLGIPVAEVARRDIPSAQLDTSLAELLLIASRSDASNIPVFDKKEFVGVIPITAVFENICTLALSSTGEDLPFMGAQ